MTPETTQTVAPAIVSGRCPNCGVDVPPGGRGRGRVFHEKECREQFAARAKAQGAVLLPIFLAWMETRHAKPGTPEYQLCRDARKEATEMARSFREEAREAGRPPMHEYVATLFRDGERYMDRTRR